MRFLTRYLHSDSRWLLLSALVGVLSGLGAVLFYALLHSVSQFCIEYLVQLEPYPVPGEPPLWDLGVVQGHPRTWVFLILIPLGALLSGLIVYWIAPEAQGHGTDAVIAAYHRGDAHIKTRVPLAKTLASAVLIGSGGSGGREGPIAQIGAGIGSYLGSLLQLRPRDRRILVAAGMGAGVGAIFRAPLAGALFSAEILYKSPEVESEVLFPSLVASVAGYSVFGSFFGWEPLFLVGSSAFQRPLELVPYGILGITCGLMGLLYIRTFYGIHDWFHRLAYPIWLKPVFGAVVVAAIAVAVPGAVSTGYGEVQKAMHGGYAQATGWLFLLAFLRIITTSFSIGSGGSGGVFGPSMVIGGCFGAAMGQVFRSVSPELVPDPTSFALVGMVCFFAGVAHAPLSTIVMVAEISNDFQLLVPCIWSCIGSSLVVGQSTLYVKQVFGRIDSRAHVEEYKRSILESEPVSRWYVRDVQTVRPGATLAQIKGALTTSPHHSFPIVDGGGRAVGIFSFHDVRLMHSRGETVPEDRAVRDMATRDALWCSPEDTLSTVAHRLAFSISNMILVTEDGEPGPFLGVLTRADLARIFEQLSMEPGQRESTSRPAPAARPTPPLPAPALDETTSALP